MRFEIAFERGWCWLNGWNDEWKKFFFFTAKTCNLNYLIDVQWCTFCTQFSADDSRFQCNFLFFPFCICRLCDLLLLLLISFFVALKNNNWKEIESFLTNFLIWGKIFQFFVTFFLVPIALRCQSRVKVAAWKLLFNC